MAVRARAGSTTTRDTALAKTALAINLEHVAAVRTKYWGPRLRMTTAVSPMRWWVNGSPRLLDISLAAFRRFNVGITADMDPGASGEMGSIARDVPTMQVITSPEIKHTEQDTPEWVPSAGPRADRARLREDHRRGEQAGSEGPDAGAARADPGCAVRKTTKDTGTK